MEVCMPVRADELSELRPNAKDIIYLRIPILIAEQPTTKERFVSVFFFFDYIIRFIRTSSSRVPLFRSPSPSPSPYMYVYTRIFKFFNCLFSKWIVLMITNLARYGRGAPSNGAPAP